MKIIFLDMDGVLNFDDYMLGKSEEYDIDDIRSEVDEFIDIEKMVLSYKIYVEAIKKFQI